jgi:hypothetical protein
MALEWVSGANFRCILHHLSSLTRWNGYRGQVRPGNDRKTKLKLYVFPRLDCYQEAAATEDAKATKQSEAARRSAVECGLRDTHLWLVRDPSLRFGF